MRKNSFLTFCFAFVPGCGQMYQGYMRRGVSLLGWFCLVIFLGMVLGMGTLSIFLLAIWAFSFFDTFNIRALSDAQRTNFRDDFIPGNAFLQKVSGGKLKLEGQGGKIMGWVFIGVGALLLYDNLIRPLLRWLENVFPVMGWLLYSLPSLLVAIAAIAVGIWILFRIKKGSSKEEFVPFSGQENSNEE